MKYSEIRQKYQHREILTSVFVDPYAQLLSPLVTKLMLRLGLLPNQVTVCMILSGIAGAALFALPPLWCKIIGVVLIHLWYVFDCSDGEVARITRRFSKFGTEIDYTAHVINHPLFLLSFLLSLLQRNTGFAPLTLALLAFALVSLNLMYRHSLLFFDLYRARMEQDGSGQAEIGKEQRISKKVILYCVSIFLHLPNFALLFPIVFFICPVATVWYLMVVLAVHLMIVPFTYFKWLKKIVKI